MAITHVGNGGRTGGTAATLTAASPAGLQNHDILLVAAETTTNAVTYTKGGSGWRELYMGVPTTPTTPTSGLWYIDYSEQSPPNMDVTKSAGTFDWSVLAFAYRPSTGNVIAIDAWDWLGTSASATVTWPSVTPTKAGDTCVFIWHTANDQATMGAISGTDPTPTERYDPGGPAGGGGIIGYSDGDRSVATATGVRTATASAAVNYIASVVLLFEQPGPFARGSKQAPDFFLVL